MVQEYERAVIFRLGRLMQGGAKGPGMLLICFRKLYIIIFLLQLTSFIHNNTTQELYRPINRISSRIFKKESFDFRRLMICSSSCRSNSLQRSLILISGSLIALLESIVCHKALRDIFEPSTGPETLSNVKHLKISNTK